MTPSADAACWHARAEPLADWALARFFVRTDRCGAYYSTATGAAKYARPATGPVPRAVNRGVLLRHFRATLTEHVIGPYSLTPEPNCTGRVVSVDIDNHRPANAECGMRSAELKTREGQPASSAFHSAFRTPHPALQERYALHLYAGLAATGFRPLLATWGEGSYHLHVLFDRDVPGPDLYAFGRRLVAGAADFGFITPVESFPKQPRVPADGYGNWLRLIGRHHTRDVWAAVWDGARWLAGAPAVEHVLALSGDAPEGLTAETAEDAETEPARDFSLKELPLSSSASSVVSAVNHSSHFLADYNRSVSLDEVAGWHERAGHRVARRRPDRIDFVRAGKTNGVSFNVLVCGDTPVTYNFSPNAGLPEGRGLTPAQVRCFYETGACDADALRRFAGRLRGAERMKDEGRRMKENEEKTARAVAGHLHPSSFNLHPSEERLGRLELALAEAEERIGRLEYALAQAEESISGRKGRTKFEG